MERVYRDDARSSDRLCLLAISFQVHVLCSYTNEPRAEARKVSNGHLCQQVLIFLAARTPVVDCPPQHIQVPFISGALTGTPIPRAIVLSRPLQNLQVTAQSSIVVSSHSQPCSRAHRNTSV